MCWCSYGWHNSSHGIVLLRFMCFYCTIQSWWYRFQRIVHISITQALNLNLAPKTFKRFVDDSHARFNNREQSLQFLDILNSQDPSIQYKIEFENENKQLNFLDITITNTGNNSYDFKIFQKTSVTNVQIKPNSNIAPHIAMGVFKGSFTSIQNIY